MTHQNVGRPTEYKPEYVRLARNYCLLGATNEDLGRFFEVTRRTIDNWIASQPEFGTAVREARIEADAFIAFRLYKRAAGYDYSVTRTTEFRGEEKTVTTELHFPPDTQACIFWLRNRQRRFWQLKAEASREEEEGPDIAALLDAAAAEVRDGADAE